MTHEMGRPYRAEAGAARNSLLSDPAFAELAATSSVIRLRKGATLYRAGEPAAALYEIAHGSVRNVLSLPDGGKTVIGFRGAGDIFGLGAAGLHAETAEAVVPTLLHVFQRDSLMRILRQSAAAACRLLQLACAELNARAQQVALLSRNDALGRLALFIRMMQDGGSRGDAVRLVMSRTDIARYIGLSTEAVSRGFRALVERKIVLFRSRRRLDVIDPASLDDLIANRGKRSRAGRSAGSPHQRGRS